MTMTTEERDQLRRALSVYVEGAPTAPEWQDWNFQRAVPDRQHRFVTGPVVALVAAASLVLVVLGGITLLLRGNIPEVVGEPVTTMTVAPSVTATTEMSLPTGPVNPAAYADVPSFQGTVRYFQHDPALGSPGWQATVSVRFAEPMRFMYTVVEERPGDDDFLFLGGAGTTFIGDGTQIWLDEADDLPPLQTQQPGFFRHLFYDSESPSPAWNEICGASPERIGVETIAGRHTSHIACSTTLEDYELWIDEESGVVLKMRGPLFVGDLHPQVDRDGGFEFTEFAIAGVSIPEVKIPQVEIAGFFPPFHMVQEIDFGGGSVDTVEYWYRDESTWRESIIASSAPSAVGSFQLVADGQVGQCILEEDLCSVVPLEGDRLLFGLQLPSPTSRVPLEFVGDHCDQLAEETILGRAAFHFACDGVRFEIRGTWVALTDPTVGRSDYWYDKGTGLAVKYTGEGWSWDTQLLELEPVFDDAIFVHQEVEEQASEPWPDTYVAADGIVPAWSGPLLDGTTLDLDDFRTLPGSEPGSGGSFVVVYDWFPTCGPICLDGITDFQKLYDKYGTTDWSVTGGPNIEFVSVVDDDVSVAQRTNERLGITVPTVACFADEIDPAKGHNGLCTPDSPWSFWSIGVPSWTVIDTDGFLVYGVTGRDYDFAELDSLLADISGLTES